MAVDRCVCFGETFAELKAHAEATGLDMQALQERFQFGRGCGLCLPYIEASFRTGRVVFEVDDPAIRKQE